MVTEHVRGLARKKEFHEISGTPACQNYLSLHKTVLHQKNSLVARTFLVDSAFNV